MQLSGMGAMFAGNLRRGFFFFEDCSGHLILEPRGVVPLYGHNTFSVTLQGRPDCLDSGTTISSKGLRSKILTHQNQLFST